jgi:H+/gluconate symporter-like permease
MTGNGPKITQQILQDRVYNKARRPYQETRFIMRFIPLLFFAAFAAVLVFTYIAVRRQWGNLRVVAALGMFGSIVTMTLALVTRAGAEAGAGANQVLGQMLLFGIILGIIGGAGALSLAWYFQTNENKRRIESQEQEQV